MDLFSCPKIELAKPELTVNKFGEVTKVAFVQGENRVEVNSCIKAVISYEPDTPATATLTFIQPLIKLESQ